MTNTDTPGGRLDPKAVEAICRTLAGLVRDRDVERVAGAIVDDLRDEGFAISVIGSATAGLPSDHAGLVADDSAAKVWDILVAGGWRPPVVPSSAISEAIAALRAETIEECIAVVRNLGAVPPPGHILERLAWEPPSRGKYIDALRALASETAGEQQT